MKRKKPDMLFFIKIYNSDAWEPSTKKCEEYSGQNTHKLQL